MAHRPLAGELALGKGAGPSGLRRRPRRRRAAARAARAHRSRGGLALRGDRRQRRPAELRPRLGGRSDRRHPRLPARTPGLGGVDRAGRRRAAVDRRARCAGARRALARAGRAGRDPQRRAAPRLAPAWSWPARACRPTCCPRSTPIWCRSASPIRSRSGSRWSAADEADLLATLRWGHEWDIAAAALIAQEAGAIVTDARGRPLRYNSTKGEAFGVLATSPGIHAAAIERLRSRAEFAIIR